MKKRNQQRAHETHQIKLVVREKHCAQREGVRRISEGEDGKREEHINCGNDE
jgi:hypothetical protein